MLRPDFVTPRELFLILDHPTQKEVETDEPFSSISSHNIQTSLRTGRVYAHSKNSVDDYKPIIYGDYHVSYADYSYFGNIENNTDYLLEIKKRKDLTEVEGILVDEHNMEYRQIEAVKDCYVSLRLFEQLLGLVNEIKLSEAKMVVPVGKWALFFLTGEVSLTQTQQNKKNLVVLGGIQKYRSSILQIHPFWENLVGGFVHKPIVTPIYHTLHAAAMPHLIPIMEIDLQRLSYRFHTIREKGVEYFLEPPRTYTIADINDLDLSFKVICSELIKIKEQLDQGPTYLSADVECFFLSIIDCIGVTTEVGFGVCVPFCTIDNPILWSLEQEQELTGYLYDVLMHPNAKHIGQNYAFDAQMYYFNWLLDIHAEEDTMVLHHILFNYLPKDLAFLASIYCEHYIYWKDEITPPSGKPWERWIYNVKDIQYTLEILYSLKSVLETRSERQQELYYRQQRRLSKVLVKAMKRGVKINVERKEQHYKFFHALMEDIEKDINNILGFEININSTPQKLQLFRDFLGIKLKVKKRKGSQEGSETADGAAMLDYIRDYPMYEPLLTLMLEYQSLKVFTNNFLGMQLDKDNRARTQYGIAATATGRLNSKKNVRGTGGNFQNIPEKGKINLKVAVEIIDSQDEEISVLLDDFLEEGSIHLPNVKQIFEPDTGKELLDGDLSGADIQIVAADSQCKWLLDFFKNPKGDGKVYRYIASEFFQREISDKEYKTYKAVFHGTNYGMQVAKLAQMARISEREARELQEFYFTLCPEVLDWQNRIEYDIKTKGWIENIFGRRAWFLNSNDATLLNKAFAFIPQSTIADVMNIALINIDEKYDWIELLMQVHDSGVFQYPIERAEESRMIIKKEMEVVIPYPEPLIIPSDFKVSTVSYGDTQKIKKVA